MWSQEKSFGLMIGLFIGVIGGFMTTNPANFEVAATGDVVNPIPVANWVIPTIPTGGTAQVETGSLALWVFISIAMVLVIALFVTFLVMLIFSLPNMGVLMGFGGTFLLGMALAFGVTFGIFTLANMIGG